MGHSLSWSLVFGWLGFAPRPQRELVPSIFFKIDESQFSPLGFLGSERNPPS